MPVAELTHLDLKARTLAKSWGLDLTRRTILRPASPCLRRHCGGSVLALGGINCLLCARPFGRDNAADMKRETGLAKAVLRKE